MTEEAAEVRERPLWLFIGTANLLLGWYVKTFK